MSTAPSTGNREFRDDVVRIASLTVNTLVLERLRFHNCQIIGPAVLVPQGSTDFIHCAWDAPDLDSVFWEIPETRQFIVGAVGALDCTFASCRFLNVGLGGPRRLRQMMEAAG